MVNFGVLTAEIRRRVWGTQQNSTGFESWLRYCTDVAQRRSTKLCTMFHRSLGWYTVYSLSGVLAPLTEFYQVQNSLCVQVLRSHVLAALLHGTRAAGIRQTLWRGTRNGITELLQRAPPIFDGVAITLDIGQGVTWPVGLSVTIMSPAKTAEPIEIPYGLWTRVVQRNHIFYRGPDPPCEGAILMGVIAAHCKV